MTSTIYGKIERNSDITISAQRRKALALARTDYSAGVRDGSYGIVCDSVRYVIASDGIHRIVVSPDGGTISDQRV